MTPDPEKVCGHALLKRNLRNDLVCRVCGLSSKDKNEFVRTSCEEQLDEVGRQFRNKLVIDGKEQLAYMSKKSDTIHLVDSEKGVGTYDWAECGMGGRLNDSIYIHQSEFDNDYIVRDGEVVGKLCGNCSITVSDDKSHFE